MHITVNMLLTLMCVCVCVCVCVTVYGCNKILMIQQIKEKNLRIFMTFLMIVTAPEAAHIQYLYELEADKLALIRILTNFVRTI